MALVCKAFGDIITFTRASTGSYFDATGTLQSAAIDSPRFDYDPSTLAAQGFLIEEARTNSIRNNTMQGAVAGTPGTVPTNWSIVFNTVTGLSSSVVGTGTENGITYIDVRINGTPSASVAQGVQIGFDVSTGISAAASQTWTESVYLKVAAGSASNIANFRINIQQYNAGVFVQSNSTVITAPSATLTRASATSTFSASTTTGALPLLALETTASAPIDITLRIGLPQLELGAFATSVIPTTTTALTRSADVASVNTLSPWYNQTAGTFYTEFSVPQIGRAGRLVAIDDGSTNNMIDATVSATNATTIEAIAAGVYGGFASAVGSITANTTQKSAFTFSTSASETACLNAGTVGSNNLTLPSASLTRMLLGRQSTGVELCGYLRRVTYYPRQFSNAELQTITT